jgi:hypothetical protein
MEIDDLPIHICLKGRKRREEINRLQHTGFALRVGACEQDHALWNIHIEAGETAEVGEGEAAEEHAGME